MVREIWPKPFKYFVQVKLFLVSLCVVISLVVAGIFVFLYGRTNELLLQRVKEQAIAYADLINHARLWNFDYGGVYVEKKKGTESDANLRKLGIAPDVKAEGGRTFTIRNHAIMISEISRMSERHDGLAFRTISLKPIDPRNAPDAFEAEALARFARGEKEAYQLVGEQLKNPVFRYLVPMHVDQTCLECHTAQGYRVGDVIGAVSITIPVATLVKETRTTRLLLILAATATIGLLVGVTYFMTWRLVVRLDAVQKRLKKQASVDALTGLSNRRKIMRRLGEEYQRALRLDAALSIVILDIDHFKQINDTFGHPFGDIVLKQVAHRMKQGLRTYDIIGRIGGEEFLVIAPGTPVEEAVNLAERVIATIRKGIISDGEREVPVTASAGVTSLKDGDGCFEELLKRADAALYQAKQEGRDRVSAA